MQRYQVYKKIDNTRMMHISSLLATSRIEANKIANDKKTNGGGGDYYVTGLVQDIGEDISNNFPPHTQRRVNNGGNKVKFKGSLYKYINEKKEQNARR
jgi:hypothetical protein